MDCATMGRADFGREDQVRITTNNVPRPVVDASELTPREREEFDYLDWSAIDAGTDSASFFRYKGQAYDLGEFMRDACPEGWDGGRADSAFSGLVVRIVEDGESVVVGLALS